MMILVYPMVSDSAKMGGSDPSNSKRSPCLSAAIERKYLQCVIDAVSSLKVCADAMGMLCCFCFTDDKADKEEKLDLLLG